VVFPDGPELACMPHSLSGVTVDARAWPAHDPVRWVAVHQIAVVVVPLDQFESAISIAAVEVALVRSAHSSSLPVPGVLSHSTIRSRVLVPEPWRGHNGPQGGKRTCIWP